MMRIASLVLLASICALHGVLAEEAAVPDKVRAALEVGQKAPDFSLPGLRMDQETGVARIDHKRPFRLSDNKGKRPVLIIFSSFT